MENVIAAAVIASCIALSDLLAGYLGYKFGRLEERARKLLPKTATADQIVEVMHEIAEEPK